MGVFSILGCVTIPYLILQCINSFFPAVSVYTIEEVMPSLYFFFLCGSTYQEQDGKKIILEPSSIFLLMISGLESGMMISELSGEDLWLCWKRSTTC